MRATRFFILSLASLAGTAHAEGLPLLLTGEVYSRQAQEIIVPLTSNWQARISRMVPEGAYVETGDVVVEFDGTEAARAMEQQRETTRTETARTERDLARLEKELIQAQYQLRLAEVTLQLANMKAEVPETLIGAIEYSENQLAKEEAIKSIDDARKQLADKSQSLADRTRQAELDAQKNELQEQWWTEMLESFSVLARQPGFVIYDNHPWTRAKYQEGDTVRTSFKIAQVANTQDLAVKVWINSVDRPRISAGEPVRVVLDAIPELEISGVIESMVDSGSKRQEWGDTVYYEGVVVFRGAQPRGLLPGMSVLVEAGS
jgi:multidrug resistance efflux pump